MLPLVSIVTVSLNAAATIQETLASVYLQDTQFDIEHICIDGGSSDDTRCIIDSWAQRNTKIVRIYESDAGIYDAMNKGIAVARGDYVLFLNADDFLISRDALAFALSDCRPGAGNNPDLILGDAVMGRIGQLGFWRRRRVPRLLRRFRGCGLYPVHQGQFTKRRLLESVGGFNTQLNLAADIKQFYDLEQRFNPTTRVIRKEVAFMRPGGAANANVAAMLRGTFEMYVSLSTDFGIGRAMLMVAVKTLQSISELRFGRCPQRRWFDFTA